MPNGEWHLHPHRQTRRTAYSWRYDAVRRARQEPLVTGDWRLFVREEDVRAYRCAPRNT